VRILVVDDDAVFREELADLLRDEKHEVGVAPSVGKALEWLAQQEADIVLTDLKMPRRGGLELLREVRIRWPRTLVVMITGFGSIDSALDAMKAGAFDYLRKPFRIEQLRATLELAGQQRSFDSPRESVRDAAAEARELARSGEFEVLFCAGAAPKPVPHLHFERLDPGSPVSLVDRVREFAAEHPRCAVVVAGLETMLERHRLEEVLAMLEQLRAILEGHGPLRVGFDPSRVSSGVATALGGTVAAAETQSTIEALANPIRRKALERLAQAPAPFGELMAAAGMDDSPKMAFHLRKLVEAGLLTHDGTTYRLTARGSAALSLLSGATLLPPAAGESNRAFAQASPGPEHRPR
jgi:CheY-like chemotaxis protein